MMITNRPFDDTRSDFEKMWRFLQQDYAHRKDDSIWLISRLGEWKYGLWREKKFIPTFFREHAQLWVDPFDQLVGFVLSEDGDDIFFILTGQGYEYLYREILDWTAAHWRPRYPLLKTEVHEHQTLARRQLADAGFHSSDVVATTRAYDLSGKIHQTTALGSGLHIVDMHENGDYYAKGLLNKNGFENEDQVSEFELLRFAYSRENPAYDARYDLSVVTAEGVHVASCVAFCDPAAGMAEIEKVCTHSDYRRRGLAAAAIRACFQRISAIGITRAYITGYSEGANRLYEKLGPCQHRKWFHYELGTDGMIHLEEK